MTKALDIKFYKRTVRGGSWVNDNHTDGRKVPALVMTATITPPADAVERADPAVRLGDYKSALVYYLQLPNSVIDRIVFIENSDSDLSSIVEMTETIEHDKDVEFISFQGNDHSPELGKAYGEFRLLDFGLDNSSLLGEDDIFWKTTGRVRVLNLDVLINSAPTDYDLLCDLRTILFSGSFRFSNNPWMDLRVYSCSLRGYRELFYGRYNKSKSRFDSRYLYHVVKASPQHLKIIPRFSRQPQLDGFSGRRNAHYNQGAQRLRHIVRDSVRRVLPQLWI